MKIRRAVADDVAAMLSLKAELRFEATEDRSTRGGFLLGSSEAGYRQKIRDGIAWVLEDRDLHGFAIALPDAAFKRSTLWASRHEVDGTVSIAAFEAMALGYFDQLAVRPGASRRYSAALALTAMMDLMESGADAMVTATVVEPVVNLAAVPFVERMGGTCVGRLRETDPHVGVLVSDIWVVPRAGFEAWMEHAPGLGARWIRTLARQSLAA